MKKKANGLVLFFTNEGALLRRFAYLLTWLLLTPSVGRATNPPMKHLSAQHWRNAARTLEKCIYGDASWMERMRQRKENRLAKALGKPSRYQILDQDQMVLPVILASYSDVAITLAGAQVAFQNALFDNVSGTITDYYDEISYGTLSVTGSVVASVVTANTKANYVAAGSQGYVTSAVTQADGAVNFSLYDNDGSDGNPNSGDDDGYVDAVLIIYPGRGNDVGDATNFNAHMSNLSTPYVTNDAKNGGGFVQIKAYTVQSEFRSDGTTIRDVGVFVHELGHVLGLPDLYDRDGSSEGVGEWSVMGSGSHGGDGSHPDTPAHMDAWCKIQMGWITPTIVTQNSSLAIDQLETNAEAFVIYEDPYYWSRFFLLENRRQTGYDQYLNGAGLLIYHIDENRRWGNAYFNATGLENDDESHKMMDVEEADGTNGLNASGNRGDAGDPWPGTSNNTTFDVASTPDTKDYDGDSTGIEIYNISPSAATMTANVVIREQEGYAVVYDDEGISGYGWGDGGAGDEYSGVLFTVGDEASLESFDLGIRESNTNYVLRVYGDFDGSTPSSLLATVDGAGAGLSNGWHTISLSEGLDFAAGETFFVSLRIIGKNYGSSFDYVGTNSGNSYFSANGATFAAFTGAGKGDMNVRARLLYPPAVPASAGTGTNRDITARDANNVTIAENTWSMIGLPVIPSGTGDPRSIFADDIDLFRMLTSNSNIYSYDEPSNDWNIPSVIANGLGYILYGFSPSSVDVSGASHTAEIIKDLSRTDNNGWHLLGNPYAVSIDWDNASHISREAGVDGLYYRWNGSEYQYYPGGGLSGTIGIWQGFWVHASVDGAAITFTYPPSSKDALVKSQIQHEFLWRVQLKAESGANIDTYNFIGTGETASQEYDAGDVFELAPLGDEFISLYFPHDDWRSNPGNFTQDIRPPLAVNGGREEWKLSLAALSGTDRVTLSWDIPTGLGQGISLYLVDEENQFRINMRQNDSYEYKINAVNKNVRNAGKPAFPADPSNLLMKTVNENTVLRNFSVVAVDESITDVARGDAIPGDFFLNQNYPNPFNPETTIEFGVQKDSFIELAIYNILGQKIRTLAQGRHAAGAYMHRWDGKDSLGIDAASGLYFYRLSGDGFSQIRKLVLIR